MADERVLQRVEDPFFASPSIVRTERPRAWNASTRQLATGWPSRWTVQAPQSPVPHPSFGPGELHPLAERVQQGLVRLDEHFDGSPFTVQLRTCFGT